MTAKPAAKKVAKKVAAPKITASIKVQGKVYTASGATVYEALEGLTVRNAKGTGILVLTKGTRRVEKILPAFAVMRLFSLSPTMRQFQLKNLYLLFKL